MHRHGENKCLHGVNLHRNWPNPNARPRRIPHQQFGQQKHNVRIFAINHDFRIHRPKYQRSRLDSHFHGRFPDEWGIHSSLEHASSRTFSHKFKRNGSGYTDDDR